MNIEKIFTYHPPTPEQLVAYQAVRTFAKTLAAVFLEHVPAGADQSAAVRKLREAVMTANAGIALQGTLD